MFDHTVNRLHYLNKTNHRSRGGAINQSESGEDWRSEREAQEGHAVGGGFVSDGIGDSPLYGTAGEEEVAGCFLHLSELVSFHPSIWFPDLNC